MLSPLWQLSGEPADPAPGMPLQQMLRIRTPSKSERLGK